MGRRSSSSSGGSGGSGSRRRNHTQARTIYPIKMASSTSTPTSSASSRTSSAQSGGGSFLSNLTSNITSIALGHALGRAISSFFEGEPQSFSTESADKVSNIPVQTIYPNKQKVNPKCMDYHKLWEQCLSINDSKQSSCTDYMEMLKSCNEQEEMRF